MSTTCLDRHKTETNTSDSTDCWSQSASAAGTSSPDENMMQNNPKESEGKQGYLETAHGYKVVRPAVSIKREVGFLKLVTYIDVLICPYISLAHTLSLDVLHDKEMAHTATNIDSQHP